MVGRSANTLITGYAENLRKSAAQGDLEAVKKFALHKSAINDTDEDGFGALQKAASEGNTQVVKFLLDNGANVDQQDKLHGNTSLHEAAWKGYSQTCELLVKSNANVYIQNKGGFAPLHLSCQNGHNQSCRVILLAGCKPDIKNNYGDTALHTAARYGHAGVTRIVLSGRANPSEINKNGDTALHISAAMNRRKLTRILLEAGTDQRIYNKQMETPMTIADRKNYADILEILRNPPPIVTPEERMRREREETKNKLEKSKKRDKNADSGNSSKESGSHPKEKKHKKDLKLDPKTKTSRLQSWGVEWSPYGCHSAHHNGPLPKDAEGAPTSPLAPGEQYYVDLAGNIKKGPAGIAGGCYCSPLFESVHNQMEKDKLDLIDHIDAANTRLGHRISSLEVNTKSHIKRLGDTVQHQLQVDRKECRERSNRIRDITAHQLADQVEKVRCMVERRPAFNQSDYRRRPFYGNSSPLDRLDCMGIQQRGMSRSKSEEAISDIFTSEPLYKGLRVLDHPTSMHDLKNSVTQDKENIIYSNINPGTLGRRRRLSDGDAGSTYQCPSDWNSEDVERIPKEMKQQFHNRKPANLPVEVDANPNFGESGDVRKSAYTYRPPPYIYPNSSNSNQELHPSYVPARAVQNVNALEASHPNPQALYQPSINNPQMIHHSPANNPQIIVTNGINEGKYSVNPSGPNMSRVDHQENHEPKYIESVATVTEDVYPRASKSDKRIVSDSSRESCFVEEDSETPMYIDMNRHLSPFRENYGNRSTSTSRVADDRMEGPVSASKVVLESSTEHDSHNDSGYSTRLGPGSQGPSPPLPGMPESNAIFRYPPPYTLRPNGAPILTKPPLPPYRAPARFSFPGVTPMRPAGLVESTNGKPSQPRPYEEQRRNISSIRPPSLV